MAYATVRPPRPRQAKGRNGVRVTESVRRASDATVAPLRRVEAISSSYGALLPLLGVAIMVGVWVYGGTAGWASGMFVTPVEAVQPIVESGGVYWRAAQATMWSALRGLVIGSTVAFVAAVIAAGVPALRRSITRLAAVANAAPWVAVAPCLIILLGKSQGPTAVAAIAVFFAVFVSTVVGLGAAPASTHDVASVLGATRRQRVWSIQLPAAWPSVADGLKLAAPAALAGAVFGEWYGAPRGLGVLLITAMQSARPSQLWAASLLSAAIGLLAYSTLAGFRSMLTNRFGSTIAESGLTAPRPKSIKVVAIEVVAVGALLAAFVSIWWLWIELADIPGIVVPRPGAVFADIAETPSLYLLAAGSTLVTAAAALAIGAIVGLTAALAASRAKILAGMSVPVVVILAATPLVALFPLLARVFGYQPNTVRLLAAVMVFYPVFVYTRSGLMAAQQSSLDVLDSMGGSNSRRFRLVVLPSAVPHIASGLRIAAGSSVIAAVVGETLIGRTGLGREFAYSFNVLQLPRAFGAALVIVVVSLAVFAAAGRFEQAIHRRWV